VQLSTSFQGIAKILFSVNLYGTILTPKHIADQKQRQQQQQQHQNKEKKEGEKRKETSQFSFSLHAFARLGTKNNHRHNCNG